MATDYARWDKYDNGKVDLGMVWTNTVEEAVVHLLIPDGIPEEKIQIAFGLEETRIIYDVQGDVKSMGLPHPLIKPERSTWSLGKKQFQEGSPHVPNLQLNLMKAVPKMWHTNAFDQEDYKELQWLYSYDQEDERVSIWFEVPSTTKVKDVTVTCKPTSLCLELASNPEQFFSRELRGPVLPDEMIWMFDDDANEGRRLRIDLVLRELENWSDGPFIPSSSEQEENDIYISSSSAV